MTKKLLMGNEAFAHAALEAGVTVVAGYPGTPSSELIETVAKRVRAGAAENVDVEWSTNEKAALELLAGAIRFSFTRASTRMGCGVCLLMPNSPMAEPHRITASAPRPTVSAHAWRPRAAVPFSLVVAPRAASV